MHRYKVVFLLLTALFYFAPRALSQTDDPNKTYQLAGNVINSVTGKPIPRVLVRLSYAVEVTQKLQNGSVKVTTGSNRALLSGPEGDFLFNDVPRGTAEIELTKPGYFLAGTVPANYNSWMTNNYVTNNLPFKVEVGPDMGKAVLKLVPGAVITGSVLGDDEEPLEGVQVRLLTLRINDGRRQLLPAGNNTLSGEDGNFRISGLMPGRYYLSVNAGSLSRTILGAQSENGGEGYPAIVYFPGGTEVAGAEPLDLAPGQHQEARFVLKTVPSFRVAGVVSNANEWKLNPPMLVDELQQPIILPSRFDRQSGVFEFRGVPAGSYWLQLGGSRQEGQPAVRYRRLVVHASIADLRLVMQPGLDIPIVEHLDFVHGSQHRRLCPANSGSEVQVSDCSDYPGVRLELRSLEFAQIQRQSDMGPLKAPLSVRGVMPGKYSVRATAMFGGYIQSVRCGGVDLLREPLVVPEEGDVSPIEVVVRDDSATLKITIRKDKPDQQVVVLVFPDPLTSAAPQNIARSGGSEVYAGPLPPGAYKVFAFDATQEFDYSSAEEMSKYSERAAIVRVGANETGNVVVDLIHPGE